VDTDTVAHLSIPQGQTRGYLRAMDFRILGALEVSRNGSGPIPLGGTKQRAVLAHLLLRANHLVPTEVLIDEIWGDEPPETARNTLQNYASRLRKALGEQRLEGNRAGYRLRAEPSELDATRFESLLRDARRLLPIDARAAVGTFDQALGLWRGPALADLAADPALQGQAARLDDLRLGALEDRIDAQLAIGQHGEVIGELEELTTRHALRERFWGQLMLALYRAGRQGEALAAYQRAREILAAELGIDPSPELRRLQERILAQSPDLDLGGEPLRGYRLLERVGMGGYGTVWRAIQPDVGRDVAVKAIHPHLANDPEFIRRFEAEAQLVARIEHPHVVPLYDYWREPGGAYLVMRFLRGGSLADLLDPGPLELEKIAGLVEQICGALAAAHRQGVVHRDVKPSNILFDGEGNAYLADFGIAKDLASTEQTKTGTIRGSLLYASPEQIGGGTLTPRADQYALGIVLFEALVGVHPFADIPDLAVLDRQLHEPLPSAAEGRPDLPPAVDGVIATATAKDPDDRFGDTAAFADAFRRALAAGDVAVAAPIEPVQVRNPYKGLRPFVEADAMDFHGREAFVERLLGRWRRTDRSSRLLAVVGPSGSGKSSAVRAGLVPAIRRGAIEGSEGWFVTEMIPGPHPLEELEAALLRVAAQPPPGLLHLLESGARGLLQAVDLLIPDGSQLLLVVDQFEELFTLTEEESERALLLESLRVAAADPSSRVRVVATLRADFYDRPLNYPRFGELLGASTEVVTPLAPDELERAIVRPAGSVGLRVEPSLVAQVASDVAAQPGALPLVQYALTELFDRRDDGLLTLSAYHDIGGVGGALAARAEHLYVTRHDAGREACRQLFLRLVSLGEGIPDARRRVPISELSAIEVDAEAMDSVLDAYGRHRLLTFDRDPATREPTVEVAHEALLRSWPRLREWIASARDDVGTLRRIEDAAAEWERSGRDASFLLRGSRLDQFDAWADQTDVAVGRTERAYLKASNARRDEEHATEAERAERERTVERRSVKRLRALVTALTVGFLVAGTLTVVAVDRNATAQRATRLASARGLSAAATSNFALDRELAVLLALESMRVNGGEALPQVEETLRRAGTAVAIDTGNVLDGPVRDVDFTLDGDMVTVAGGDGAVGVWDLRTGARMFEYFSEDTCGSALCPGVLMTSISDDGSRLAAVSYPHRPIGYNTFHVWDLGTDREISRVGWTPGKWAEGTVMLSPDGSMLATGQWEQARVLSVGTGRTVWTLGRARIPDVPQLTFSPDATHLFVGERSAGDSTAPALVDAATGEVKAALPEHISEGAPSFSADGTRVVFQHNDRGTSTTVWDVPSGREIASAPSDPGIVSMSPDGSIVAVTRNGGVELWDTDTLEPIRSLQGLTFGVGGIAFDGQGDRIAIVTQDGTVGVWNVTTGKHVYAPPAEASDVNEVTFSEDGSRLVVVYDDGRILSHPFALDDAIEIARSRITGSFTEAECRTYLHVASCPTD
jgi:serine/threonine protein kinase/WD40 repeat protein/DNA-binding winged helix-turn-helix (wHTH) protein